MKKSMYMSSIIKIPVTGILFVVFAIQGFAQFSVEKFLAAPFQSAEISGLAKQLEYIDDESFRSPIFRELELRLRTDDLNLSPDDIRLRLGIINPFEQIANRKYENTQTEYIQLKYNFETNLLLANRYKQLIQHYYLKEYESLLDTEIELLKSAYAVMQDGKGSFKDWVETDERILKKELDRKEVLSSVELLEYTIRETIKIDDSIYWDDYDVVSVEKMQEILLNDNQITPPRLELALKSFELNQQAFKVEKAESWSNIGFIQAEYELKSDDPLKQNLGFQMGITLPVFNPDKPKLQQEKLQLIEQESEIQEVKDENSIEQFKLQKEFSKHIWCYQEVSTRLADIETLGKNSTYDNMEDFIALTNYHSNLRILQHKIYLQCLQTYIKILAFSGRLSDSPYVNYLSNEQNALRTE